MRLWELDFLRGLAVILMIAFHVVFDLIFFFHVSGLTVYEGFWFYEGKAAAILFMLVSGMTIAALYRKKSDTRWKKIFWRAFRILLPALVITAVTWVILPKYVILFGILHFFAASTLLAVFFVRLGKKNILVGIFFLILGIFTQKVAIHTLWLIPLGIAPASFETLDYYPLIPWFGIVLIGMGIGAFLYREYKSALPYPGMAVKPVEYVGRHSLVFYLAHQPIILVILAIVLSSSFTRA